MLINKVIPRCLISPQKHQQNIVSTIFLEFIVKNGCKFVNLSYTQVEGSLNLPEESELRYLDLTLCEAKEDIFVNLLNSCQSLEKLSLAYLDIFPTMIQSICYQNGKTLQILGGRTIQSLNYFIPYLENIDWKKYFL